MNKMVKIVISVVVVLAVAFGGFLWWFFSGDTPAEVSLDDATASVEVTTEVSTDSSAGVEGTATTPADVSGTWTVDVDSGDFDYETATGTFAGFRIDEELSGIGSTTAVGRTGDVAGTMTIDGTILTAASFEIDLTTITTDDSRRDDNVQDALDATNHPTATFVLGDAVDLGEGAASGDPVSVVATGDLTVHGVTNTVQFALDAQLVGSTVVVVGTTDVTFSDYGLEVPSSPIVLSVADAGTLELQFLLVQQ